MFVLDDNNNYVEPTHMMVTLAVVTVWCSQIDACRWCSWSLGDMLMTLMVPCMVDELIMIPWWFDWWWWWRWSFCWWCNLEMPCWFLMSSQSSLMHVVGSHAIWFLGAMGLTHDGGVMVAWWVSAMLMMTWYIDGDDIPFLDDMMEMTYMMPWLLMRIPYPFLNPSSTLAPYTTP